MRMVWNSLLCLCPLCCQDCVGLLDAHVTVFMYQKKVNRYFLKEPNLYADCIKLILNALNLTEDEFCSSWHWSLVI